MFPYLVASMKPLPKPTKCIFQQLNEAQKNNLITQDIRYSSSTKTLPKLNI
jgi:hypothetical protein